VDIFFSCFSFCSLFFWLSFLAGLGSQSIADCLPPILQFTLAVLSCPLSFSCFRTGLSSVATVFRRFPVCCEEPAEIYSMMPFALSQSNQSSPFFLMCGGLVPFFLCFLPYVLFPSVDSFRFWCQPFLCVYRLLIPDSPVCGSALSKTVSKQGNFACD